jgi:hypothetical protein
MSSSSFWITDDNPSPHWISRRLTGKTRAYIGDLFMSLIHTCTLNHVNPFHYLTTLQKYSSELFKNPKGWLPWNYQQALTNLT